MIDKIKSLIVLPVMGDEEEARKITLLNGFLFIAIISATVSLVIALFDKNVSLFSTTSAILLSFTLLNILLIFILRSGHTQLTSFLFMSLAFLRITAETWFSSGVSGHNPAFYLIVIMAAALLLGWRVALLFTGLSVITVWVLAYLEGIELITIEMSLPYTSALIWTILFVIGIGVEYLSVSDFIRLRQLAESRSRELESLTANLDTEVKRRIHDLQNVAKIGSYAARSVDIEKLMQNSVDTICEQYDLYQVQIYLLERISESTNALILHAVAGEIEERIPEWMRRLPLISNSSQAIAVLEKRTVWDSDTAVVEAWQQAKSEIVVPLLVGDRILGILNIQHTQIGTFNESHLSVFETMGSQIAIAIDNAQLLAERQQAADALLYHSETLFSTVLNNAMAVIYIKQVDGKYLLVNKQYETIFGISNEEIKGKTDHDIFPVDTANAMRQSDLDILDRQDALSYEEEIPHADGIHTYTSVKFPLFDKKGEMYAVAGISTDVTNMKEVELALAGRVAQLNLFNAIGRKISEMPQIVPFLEWTAAHIPQAMRDVDNPLAAILYEGQIYGDAAAIQTRNHIVEGLHVQNEYTGQLIVAYQSDRQFEEDDKIWINSISHHITSYLETRMLLTQVQTHADELQIVAEVGTAVASILDPQELLQTVVNLIEKRFNLYHVHVFLMDEKSQDLLSVAGSGEIGRRMAAGQKIIIGTNNMGSVVARTAREQRGIIVNDVRIEASFLSHPLIPDIRSELTVPMIVGERLMGVLDIQSDKAAYFDNEAISVYITLATQIGIALQNAQQYEKTQTALQNLGILQRVSSYEGWQTFLTSANRDMTGYTAVHGKTTAIKSNDTIEARTDDETLTIPLAVRGTTIGGITVKMNGRDISDDDLSLLDSISEEVAEALERARLFEEKELSRHQTETLYDIGRILPTIDNTRELLQTIADSAAKSINANNTLLLLCDMEKEIITHIVSGGEKREGIDPDIQFEDIWDGLSGWALREKETAFVPKFMRDERETVFAHEYRLTHNIGSILVVPLIYQDHILGTLTVTNKLSQPDFTQAEVELLTAFGVQATVAIENRNLLDETEKRAGRERTLREITNRVNNTVDVESVLKTAVKEVGQAMGLEIFAYLDEVEE